jgi:predicted nucleotidyltransferase
MAFIADCSAKSRRAVPMHDDGLTPRQRAILHDVLAPFAEKFDQVGLFGSRATGRAGPRSDVDLVIYGADDPRLVDQLFTLFDESLLPMTVDVVDYDRIDHPPLKDHIDAVVRILFDRRDLIAPATPP